MSRNHILIVDDEPYNLKVVGSLLVELDYNVGLARNGKEALDRVKTLKPELILMDVIMPEMDGFEACRQLKSSESTRHIPIIMLSGLNSEEDIAKGLECGADDFLSKPVRPLEMKARIKSLLRSKKNYDKLQEVQNMRDSLVQMVAHDLRVPLTVIKCVSSMLQKGSIPMDQALGLLKRIYMGSNQAENLINDMLTVANSNNLDSTLKFSDLNVTQYLDSTLDDLKPIIDDAEINLEVIHNVDKEFKTQFDPYVISRVIDNLIQNAIKFSPKNGKISIRTFVEDENNWGFSISDEGCGFDNDEDIFDLYVSKDKASGSRKSFGLGLHFCKLVVNAHKGKIKGSSNIPNGALFKIILPATAKSV